MSFSILGGIFFILMGLGEVWVGISMVHVNRSAVYDRDGQPHRRASPTETRLWLAAWTMIGLAFVCLGVTTLRYAKGQYVSVPASAPLLDHVIWVLVFVGIVGGMAALLMWTGVYRTAEKKHSRRQDGGVS